MFVESRDDAREFFFLVWQKMSHGQPLQAVETIVAETIRQHPEYHDLFADAHTLLNRDYTPTLGETNPFLHMGLHIALREQLQADRPPGIRGLYQTLVGHEDGATHTAEHKIMECLAAALWQAERNRCMPDEKRYLDCVKRWL